MKSIKEKKVTRKARVEIVNSVYSRMVEEAQYPTSEQYSIVCWRLIEDFEELRDKAGSGIVRLKYCIYINYHRRSFFEGYKFRLLPFVI